MIRKNLYIICIKLPGNKKNLCTIMHRLYLKIKKELCTICNVLVVLYLLKYSIGLANNAYVSFNLTPLPQNIT